MPTSRRGQLLANGWRLKMQAPDRLRKPSRTLSRRAAVADRTRQLVSFELPHVCADLYEAGLVSLYRNSMEQALDVAMVELGRSSVPELHKPA